MKKEIKKYNLNDFNFYEDENLIRIQRDVDVGKHLPQEIIGKGKEFTKIRELENYELSNLWIRFNKTFENFYIQLSGEQGLGDYEQLIDSDLIKGDLEEKRRIIYALWNMRRVWTHRTLEEWLNEYIGRESYRLEFHYNEYYLEIKVILKNNKNIPSKILLKQLREIIPANLGILWTLEYEQYIYYAMANQERKKITVYPREAEDITGSLLPRFGAGAYAYKVKYKDKPIEVWTTDKYGFMTEVTGVNGEVLKYDRDTR